MRTALQEEKCPLDACLESVLPGVHQWHQANNQAVVRLVDRLDVFGEAVAGGINTLITKIDRLEQQRIQNDRRLANMLEMGAHAFRNDQQEPSQRSTTTANSFEFEHGQKEPADSSPTCSPMQQGAVAAVLSECEDELKLHASYRMRPKHRYLTSLYDEWMGFGEFSDEYGGIEGRNKKHGARWRKHLTPHIYSRTARTVDGIRAYAAEQGMDIHDACATLQTHYEARKCSVANMVNYFMEINILDKKMRRGKAVNQ
jgi:Transcriptional activator of glycolytic enzymes